MHLPTVLTVLHTYSKSLFFLSVFIRAGNANAWAALFEIHCMFLVTNSLQDPASGVESGGIVNGTDPRSAAFLEKM